ncbi:cation diffusion facilitator family transporter [Phormidium sp. CLA17]|uniref:cation diffusion facilitator family transporter n=1 Tax=Leptolyngbya sp. Cla-17 TaxID=2803751 RepID=UPI00149247E9|nr:cation diffusion facilitator family transporter [Leptolyngbya sp. Cla-17]MBM0743725.1 cation diffusion facilitator family transporter [Leptolyngbya sp. Cla-17]
MTEVQSHRWADHRGWLVALWLTLMILAMKVWIGLAIQSLSLLAASIHSLVTSFSLMLSWLTLAFSGAPGRDIWGHRKIDTILTLVVTSLIGFTGCTILIIAVQQVATAVTGGSISRVEPINLSLIYLFVAMIAINFCMGIFGRSHAQMLESPSLSFSFGTSLQDAVVMIIVMLELVISGWMWGWLDSVVAIAIIGVAIANGWRILNRQIPSLVNQVAIAPEALIRTIRRVEGIVHCYGIRSQGMVGRWTYVEMSLILHPEYLHLSNAIIHQAQQAIYQDYGSTNVVIHIEGDSAKQIPHKNSGIPLGS